MASHQLLIRPSRTNIRAARKHLTRKQCKQLNRGQTVTINLPADKRRGKQLQAAFEGTAFVS